MTKVIDDIMDNSQAIIDVPNIVRPFPMKDQADININGLEANTNTNADAEYADESADVGAIDVDGEEEPLLDEGETVQSERGAWKQKLKHKLATFFRFVQEKILSNILFHILNCI